LGAQSCGEPLSQMNLSSFHSAGIGSMTYKTVGGAKMKELLSLSKKPKSPQMKVYLEKQYRFNKDIAKKIASHMEYITISHIKKKSQLYYEPNPHAEDSFTKKDNVGQPFQIKRPNSNTCQNEIDNLPWLLRIEIDREKMLEKGITLLEIKAKFCDWWIKRNADTKSGKKEKKKVLQKITNITILSNNDSSPQPVIHIRFLARDLEKDLMDHSTMEQFVINVIGEFKLKGIANIKRINGVEATRMVTFGKETNYDTDYYLDYQEKDDPEDFAFVEEYVIYSAGVNLVDIRYINGIDLTRTLADDIVMVYEAYGIEVARAALLQEFVWAYENAGARVNYQHLSILADIMTYNGYLMSIDRHGINKSNLDVLSKASFEKTIEQLIVAAVFSRTDHMRGISSRIMAGATIKGGTGYPVLKFDISKVENLEHSVDDYEANPLTSIEQDTIATDILNNKSTKNIFIPV